MTVSPTARDTGAGDDRRVVVVDVDVEGEPAAQERGARGRAKLVGVVPVKDQA